MVMADSITLNRHDPSEIGAIFGALSDSSPVKAALAQSLRRTPDQILGPFYPVTQAPDAIDDLTRLPGRSGRAQGDILNVMGRVLNIQGEPVRGAKLELWQANARGRYAHPADKNPTPLDPNFDGAAVLRTDAEGRYRFKTIMPGAYRAGTNTMRPPHIHFRLVGKYDEFVTQMYFQDEALNDQDRFLQSTLPDERSLLICKLLPPTPEFEPDSRLVMFDIVTLKG
jgi:protocatechuate 3,4-dioxygenase, beta subunit